MKERGQNRLQCRFSSGAYRETFSVAGRILRKIYSFFESVKNVPKGRNAKGRRGTSPLLPPLLCKPMNDGQGFGILGGGGGEGGLSRTQV